MSEPRAPDESVSSLPMPAGQSEAPGQDTVAQNTGAGTSVDPRAGGQKVRGQSPDGQSAYDRGVRNRYAETELEAVFRSTRPRLQTLLYRLTGSPSDAEDLVQATFERALSRPPRDLSLPWEPWLIRVAVNLGRDQLRRRRRRAYEGSWLPTPVEVTPCESSDQTVSPSGDGHSRGASRRATLRATLPESAGLKGSVEEAGASAQAESHYALRQEASYAFLVALETLTPTQRAVLLLREVLEYDTQETARVLELRETSVRQHLRRARLALARRPEANAVQPALSDPRARELMQRFFAAIQSGDRAGVEALLSERVVLHNDAGGEFHTARVPVVGRSKVARFYINISRLAHEAHTELRCLNGGLGVLTEIRHDKPGFARRIASVVTLDADGRISEIFSVLATHKLAGIAHIERAWTEG